LKYQFIEQECNGGIQRIYTFPNGYGASVVKHDFSYGGKQDKWELALLKDDALLYEPPLFEDVIGHLTNKEVDNLLQQISMFTEDTFSDKR
jgi:hypothetical protein